MWLRPDPSLSRARALRVMLRLVPGALVLLALVVGGVHHHASEIGSHPCAICSLSHTPAAPTVAVAATAPAMLEQSVAVEPALAAHAAELATPSSRGPPSA